MTGLWLFAARAAAAASYATLGITDPATAGDLAWPFGSLVCAVAVWDLRSMRSSR